jgi:multiple sugar transport system permease protein
LASPGVATVSALNFLAGWGEFLFSLVLISSTNRRPLALGLYTYIGTYFTRWNDLMAVAVITAVPAFLVLVLAQRYLVTGLAVGATKG